MRGTRGKSKKGNGIQSGTEINSEEIWSADGECGGDPCSIYTQGEEESCGGESQPQPEESKGLNWLDIKHFSPSDFACRCTAMCDHTSRISLEFVRKLDMLREQLGLPVQVNSGTRCAAYQTRVINGSPHSAHVPNGDGVSHAADIRIPTPEYLHKFLSLAFDIGFSGIGIGKGWVHVESTGRPARVWTYPPMKRK